jgi:hypothetical protein
VVGGSVGGGCGFGRSTGSPGEKAIHSQCGGGGLAQKLRTKKTSGLSDVGGKRIGCDGCPPLAGGVIVASPVIVALRISPPSPVILALLIVICCIFGFFYLL